MKRNKLRSRKREVLKRRSRNSREGYNKKCECRKRSKRKIGGERIREDAKTMTQEEER